MDVRAQMLVFPGFWAPWPKFWAGISARMTPGCPRDIRPKNLLFGLIFRSWQTLRVHLLGIDHTQPIYRQQTQEFAWSLAKKGTYFLTHKLCERAVKPRTTSWLTRRISTEAPKQGRALYGPIPVKTETFRELWAPLVHTNFGGNSYGPIIGPYLFLGKFVWTNGPESFSEVSPYTGIGPWMALPS